jgi:hypothetical protein
VGYCLQNARGGLLPRGMGDVSHWGGSGTAALGTPHPIQGRQAPTRRRTEHDGAPTTGGSSKIAGGGLGQAEGVVEAHGSSLSQLRLDLVGPDGRGDALEPLVDHKGPRR